MKNNFFLTVIAGLLLLSTLASIGLMWSYTSSLRYLENPLTQRKMEEIKTASSFMNGVLSDTAAYNQTKRDPELARILQSAPLKK